MSGNTEEVLGVLREVWGAQGQTAEDVEEACGPSKSCKRMSDVGFEGIDSEANTYPARRGDLDLGQDQGRPEPLSHDPAIRVPLR